MNELKVWYDFGEKIGEGGFGMVMSVKDRSTNKKWAMKVVFKTNASPTLESNSSQLFLFKGRESADVGATGDTDSEADPTPPHYLPRQNIRVVEEDLHDFRKVLRRFCQNLSRAQTLRREDRQEDHLRAGGRRRLFTQIW